MTPQPQQKEWTFEPFDAGMGETEYNVFYGGVFFAKVDNRADVAALIHAMKQTNKSRPAPSHSECYKKGYADAVANALSQHADCVKCLEEDRVTMLEHDATIRNQTLDALDLFIDAHVYNDMTGIVLKRSELDTFIESLRHQSTEARK